jgi:hypothetical protein
MFSSSRGNVTVSGMRGLLDRGMSFRFDRACRSLRALTGLLADRSRNKKDKMHNSFDS